MIAEIMFKLHGTAFGQLDMLIHQSLFTHPFAISEYPQQFHRIYAPLHPFLHKDMATVKDDAGYIFR